MNAIFPTATTSYLRTKSIASPLVQSVDQRRPRRTGPRSDFGELDVRALRSNMITAGDDPYFDNRPSNILHSIVAPSILFDELEVKRANINKEKLPEYPAPTPR